MSALKFIEDQSPIEIALRAADAESAGHWPTVAGILADAYRESVAELKRQRTELVKVAASLAMGNCMPPTDADDWGFSPSTPKREQAEVLKWAKRSNNECSRLARKIKDIIDPLA